MELLRKSLTAFLIVCMTAVFIPLAGLTANAEEGETNPRIYVDGQKIETDVDPYIVNDRTLVPVALIVNFLGGVSEWDGVNKEVTLTHGQTVIHLKIGSPVLTVNGVEQTLDVAPELKVVKTGGDGARTMVPLRFVAEAFNFSVGWDGDSTTVYVESGAGQAAELTMVRSVYLIPNQVYAGKYYTYVTINANKSLREAMILEHTLISPNRYYIDFDNIVFADTVPLSQTQDVSTSYVTGVRVNTNWDGTARLVVDLTKVKMPKVSFSDTGNEMTLSFLEDRDSGNASAPADQGGTGTSDDQGGSAQETPANPVTPDNPTAAQIWTPGNKDTTTVTNTRKYDTVSMYTPFSDGHLVVCIDPGHGASTGGKRSFDNSLLEWEFNRSVAYKLKAILESKGIECVMTVAQEDMNDPALADRVAIANSNKNIDLFVSIHANAFGRSWNSATGWEVYSYQKGGVSERAAKYLEAAKNTYISEIRDRGLKTSDFYVIKNTEMPAVLIEHGFYTNWNEVQYLKSDAFRDRFAQCDAAGIIDFFNSFK